MDHPTSVRHFDHCPWLFEKEASQEQRTAQRERQQSLGGDSEVGERCYVAESAAVHPDHLRLGGDSCIAAHAYITGDVTTGTDCPLNPFTVIRGTVTLGNVVRVGAHTSLLGFNHSMAPDRPVFHQAQTSRGIAVGDDVWIGSHVVVVDGVSIGDHCVIGAEAVVTKNPPPWAVAAGNPARRIRDRRQPRADRRRSGNGYGYGYGGEEPPARFAATARAQAVDILDRSWDGEGYVDRPGAAPTVRAHCDAVEVADLLLGSPPPQLPAHEHMARLIALQAPGDGPGPRARRRPPDGGGRFHRRKRAPLPRPVDGLCAGSPGRGFPPPGPRCGRDDRASADRPAGGTAVAGRRVGRGRLDRRMGDGGPPEPTARRARRADAGVRGHPGCVRTGVRGHPGGTDTDTGVRAHRHPGGPLRLAADPTPAPGRACGAALPSPPDASRSSTATAASRAARSPSSASRCPTPNASWTRSWTTRGTPATSPAARRTPATSWTSPTHCGSAPANWARAPDGTGYRAPQIHAWADARLTRALSRRQDGQGFGPGTSGPGPEPGLQGTEMWLGIVRLLADLLGRSDALGYRPRGVHRPDPVGLKLSTG